MSTNPALDQIKNRVEGHTEGPWELAGGGEWLSPWGIDIGSEDSSSCPTVRAADAELFIAAPKLLAALEAVEALHRPEKRWMPYRGADCSYDTAEEAAQDLGHTYTADPSNMPFFEVCAHCKTVEEGPCEGECTRESGYKTSLWPCPTIAAIEDALS